MTRSVEIPEAARDAAKYALIEHMREWRDDGTVQCKCGWLDDQPFGWPLHQAEVAIAAALPYLVPAEPAKCHRCGYDLQPDDTYTRLDGTTYHLRSCPDRPPAPAGNGGLREALSAAVYEKSAAVVLEGGYITTLIAPEDAVAAVMDRLAAHPAAHAVPTDTAESTASTSAVPQPASEATPELTSRPVDREALRRLAAEWRQSADEDERYLNRAHASEIHDVMASIRINREHADAVLAVLAGEQEQVEP